MSRWFVVSSGSKSVNVAIIAPRDEARSQDDDRFEFASNKFRSSFLKKNKRSHDSFPSIEGVFLTRGRPLDRKVDCKPN